MSELATQFDVHPNQIKQWKDQLLDGVTDVFDDKPKASKEPEIDVKSMHAKIGQLTLGNNFFWEERSTRHRDPPRGEGVPIRVASVCHSTFFAHEPRGTPRS